MKNHPSLCLYNYRKHIVVTAIFSALFSLGPDCVKAQVIIIPNPISPTNTDPSLERAKFIRDTLQGRDDVRNIELRVDKTKPNRPVTGVCYEEKTVYTQLIVDQANHLNAYRDGFNEGKKSSENKDKYESRSAGGEFARGFDDGYYARPYLPDVSRVVQPYEKSYSNWQKKCADI